MGVKNFANFSTFPEILGKLSQFHVNSHRKSESEIISSKINFCRDNSVEIRDKFTVSRVRSAKSQCRGFLAHKTIFLSRQKIINSNFAVIHSDRKRL